MHVDERLRSWLFARERKSIALNVQREQHERDAQSA
jgi:hypothetical protein